jgi:hypothetical protein
MSDFEKYKGIGLWFNPFFIYRLFSQDIYSKNP